MADDLLLEDGFKLQLETGTSDSLLLETSPPTPDPSGGIGENLGYGLFWRPLGLAVYDSRRRRWRRNT